MGYKASLGWEQAINEKEIQIGKADSYWDGQKVKKQKMDKIKGEDNKEKFLPL